MITDKIFTSSEMDVLFNFYRSTSSIKEFMKEAMKELFLVDERDQEAAICIWQAFDYMYDHFSIQSAEEE
jgi:hypothetical protein